MKPIAVVDGPSILGLKPQGVERLPEALKAKGLIQRVGAEYHGRVVPISSYSYQRDSETNVLNSKGIREFSISLSNKIRQEITDGFFPLVLGGDCSILIGCMLALRQLGNYGLFFIDGHADFYQPSASPTGEVADMDLAIVTGRGPEILTNIDGLKPLVRDEHTVAFGYRDVEEQQRNGSQDVKTTGVLTVEWEDIRKSGITNKSSEAIDKLIETGIDGFWIHLDVDVLDDAIMPAVDYRTPGGLSFRDLSNLLTCALGSKRAVGMDIAIFNPELDPDGSIAEELVDSIARGFEKGTS
ncbi:MAG: arginase family protein [Candidatus Bathyarchaeia archaeon]|jgi:arginase